MLSHYTARSSRCTEPFHSHNLLKSTSTASPRTKLASLVKGRWIDGKAQTVASLRLLAIYLPFLFAKLFCRQDGGIATPLSLRPTPTPPKTALSLAPHHILGLWTLCWLCILAKPLGVQLRASMPVPCQRELDCDKATSYHKLPCSAIQVYLISSQFYLSQDWGIVTPSPPSMRFSALLYS